MNLKVLSKSAKTEKTVKMPEEVLNADNTKVISEYINFVRAARRQAIAQVKDRSEVSGGGKKPWRQKGTGHARHGSSRSPLWVGGGVTFGPSSERNYWLNLPKKVRQYGRFAILNIFANDKKIVVIDELIKGIDKTKKAEELLSSYELSGKISIIMSAREFASSIAYRNLPYVTLMTKTNQNIVHMASSDIVVFTKEGFEEYFAKEEINATDN